VLNTEDGANTKVLAGDMEKNPRKEKPQEGNKQIGG
jgi:hypothetical protein